MKTVTVLHDFDGKPYFKALEQVARVEYLNTRPFRFMLRDLVKHRRIQRETLRSLLFLFKLPFIRQHTIVLGMAPFNIRLLIYGLLCRHNRVFLHTSWHRWQHEVPFEYPAPVRGWVQKAWRRLLPRMSGVVAVTEGTRRSVREFIPALADKMVTLPHVVDIAPIDPQACAQKWQQPPNQFLFTGRLTAAKGIDTYLELAAYAEQAAPQMVFHAAGRGEGEEKFSAFQREHGNFHFHGFLSSRERLRALMAQSHFLLLPSRRVNGWEELFGLVVIEAMSQGCVVIASDHIGPGEIISQGTDGVLCGEADFADRVKSLFADLQYDNGLYARMALRARETSQHYSMAAIAEKWSALINDV